ncbi:MAG: ParA family protein [Actinomycetes bacterium]
MLVLGVCSLKGGVGKTSVVLGLASAARERGVPTLVVDLDPQGDATTGLDVDLAAVTSDGALEVADVLESSRVGVVRRAVVPTPWSAGGAVDVVPGGERTAAHDVPELHGRRLHRLGNALRHLADDYRLVLLDCPPSLGGLTRAGLTASDRALVVTEPGLFALSPAERALRTVADLRQGPAPDLQPLGVLVNRVRARSSEHDYRLEELKRLFGPLVLSPMLPERSALQQAQGTARPLHEWPGPGARELADMFDQLLARVLRARPRRRAA